MKKGNHRLMERGNATKGKKTWRKRMYKKKNVSSWKETSGKRKDYRKF